MTEFDVLGLSADGMDAQRAALEVAARNVAAAQAASGGSFTRLIPQFEVSDGGALGGDDDGGEASVRFIGTQAQPKATGDVVTEMVAILNAQRAYEANASVFDAGKRLMERTIDLGRV